MNTKRSSTTRNIWKQASKKILVRCWIFCFHVVSVKIGVGVRQWWIGKVLLLFLMLGGPHLATESVVSASRPLSRFFLFSFVSCDKTATASNVMPLNSSIVIIVGIDELFEFSSKSIRRSFPKHNITWKIPYIWNNTHNLSIGLLGKNCTCWCTPYVHVLQMWRELQMTISHQNFSILSLSLLANISRRFQNQHFQY